MILNVRLGHQSEGKKEAIRGQDESHSKRIRLKPITKRSVQGRCRAYAITNDPLKGDPVKEDPFKNDPFKGDVAPNALVTAR